jgi:hypothetical protein
MDTNEQVMQPASRPVGIGVKPPKPDATKKHPFLKKKLAEATKLLNEVGIPDDVAEYLKAKK